MNLPQAYILIAIIILAGILGILAIVKKNPRKAITPLASVAFAFVIAGIVFSERREISYGLMGLGVMLAVIDIVRKTKQKDRPLQ